MDKLIPFYVLVSLGFVLTCTATMYTVGDSSGWDISSDIDSWAKGKRFQVGDVLLFLYSSAHSVSEVTKDDFKGCNVANTLGTSSNSNTTISLSTPGQRYFVCGNKLHCLGGMKLQVDVNADTATSPASAPQPSAMEQGGPSSTSSFPHPSSKKNNPSAIVPASTGFIHGMRDSLFVAFIIIIVALP
ncbi:hypothetical protein HHK36_028084 [Tetracentron sinense]|uniref:Phytocyanin domain-containing protein n=1 Tax=Tetracentron sinense TaxID=13715 RepID=A0A834YJA0_TETSI|nr:hypothetical protein HHK36_028084 [Tetracentron sinense]